MKTRASGRARNIMNATRVARKKVCGMVSQVTAKNKVSARDSEKKTRSKREGNGNEQEETETKGQGRGRSKMSGRSKDSEKQSK